MTSVDPAKFEERARRLYEWSRVRLGLLGSLPPLVITLLATCFSHRVTSTLVIGLFATISSFAMIWYGRDARRAAFVGLATGLVPLALSLCANEMHHCGGDACRTLCVPLCTMGGAFAGFVVARDGTKRHAGVPFWISSITLSLLTGAMGCACLGYSGVIGLLVGFGTASLPLLLRRAT